MESEGRDAWARDEAKSEVGTSCKTCAKLKATIEPTAATEAIATFMISARRMSASDRDLGHINLNVVRTSLLLKSSLGLYLNPRERARGSWISRCRIAPK